MAFHNSRRISHCALACAGLFIGIVPTTIDAADSALARFFARDVEVVTVTDFTPTGRELPAVSPNQPVYCAIFDLGFTDFGDRWGGIKPPASRPLLLAMIKALAAQGYLVADEAHPPTQTLFFAWGALARGSGAKALSFLGGEKLDMMWEFENVSGMLSPREMRRGVRSRIQSKVWDISQHDLYLSVVRSYDSSTVEAGELTLYWETRFACPANGLGMSESLPLMILAAAANLGVETERPVSINASRKYEGTIEFGELETIGIVEPDERPADTTEVPPSPPTTQEP